MAEATPIRRAFALVCAVAALACAEGERPALVLITVDTLRADRLGSYGSTAGATPNLDALAREASLFEQAYAPAPFTRPSIAALLSGQEPAEIGVLSNRAQFPPDVPTLAQRLADAGWATGAVVSNPVLKRHTGIARGFDAFDDTIATPAGSGFERTAVATTDAAVAVLDRLRAGGATGLFLWVHYQDPHGPYTPPPGYSERFLPDELRRADASRVLAAAAGESGQGAIPRYQLLGDERRPAFYRAGYTGETLHVDEQIGRLLAALRERGLYAGAVIAFASDHGEGLGENDYWFAHGENLSEGLLRVPLLIRSPQRPPQRRSDVASLIDLAGTLAGEFGLDFPASPHARSLWAADAAAADAHVFVSTLSYVSPAQFGMVNRDFRYVIDKHGDATRERLFATGAPETDLAAEHPEVLTALATLTRQRVRALKRGRAEVRAETTPAERERLRALGYIDDD